MSRLITNFPCRRFAESDLRHSANTFTILRWALASAVIFSHSFVLTGTGTDPSVLILPFPVSRLAVLLFFTLSGFLVTGSLEKRGVVKFAVARAVRLLPGLWAMLAATAVCIALAFPAAVPTVGFVRYVVRNAVLLSDAFAVPHTFDKNPVRDVINGSLWTLRQEARCYLILAGVGALGLLRFRRWLLIAFICAIAVHLMVPMERFPLLIEPRSLGISFSAGVLFYLWRSNLYLSWPVAISLAIGSMLIPHSEIGRVAVALSAAYLVLVSAFCPSTLLKRVSAALPDYSYGIYIYAYPIQQSLIASHATRNPLSNAILAFIPTLLIAAVSWHLIESPALRLKNLRLSSLRQTLGLKRKNRDT